ncbi:lymphocyte antigen 6G-like [Mastacembelus armatus]|uniref:lymphocyte antigen 6G-like n=1 Tax=Mastacembelus armatus TaxID=205130 RepID=UPI000E457DEA|nr:lymphocyte antigen 6G-like [Mastacembelus armatus]
MMQLYRALILFMVLGTACGLRCYTCVAAGSTSCTTISTCPDIFNRCFSMKLDVFPSFLAGGNLVTKGCQSSLTCSPDMNCCEGDLCNSDIPTGSSAISTGSSAIPTGSSAIPTGSSVFLLLVSSAITSLFL